MSVSGVASPATTKTDIPEMGVSVFSFPAPLPVHSRIFPSSPLTFALRVGCKTASEFAAEYSTTIALPQFFLVRLAHISERLWVAALTRTGKRRRGAL